MAPPPPGEADARWEGSWRVAESAGEPRTPQPTMEAAAAAGSYPCAAVVVAGLSAARRSAQRAVRKPLLRRRSFSRCQRLRQLSPSPSPPPLLTMMMMVLVLAAAMGARCGVSGVALLGSSGGSALAAAAQCCPADAPGAFDTSEEQRSGHPNVGFIIGAQKSGTTWLFHELLQRHPHLASWRPRPGHIVKEPHFFDVLLPPPVKQYLRGLEGSKGASATYMDGTPDYLHVPAAACRLHAALPHARLLVVLRDPVRRALSGYNMVAKRESDTKVKVQPFAQEVESELLALRMRGCSFEAAVGAPATDGAAASASAEEHPLAASATAATYPSWNDCFRCTFTYCGNYTRGAPATDRQGCSFDLPRTGVVRRGLYVHQLEWWLQFYPPSQVMVISYERMKSDEGAALKQIVSFLGQDASKLRKPTGRSVGFKIPHGKDESTRLRATIDALYEYYAEPNERLYALIKERGIRGWTGSFPASHAEYEERLVRGLDP